MGTYFTLVFCQLEGHTPVWARTPRDQVVVVITEYKYLAESVARQYGSVHQNFTTDGHLFLFENADVAVQFSFKLIDTWMESDQSIPALRGFSHVPLRLGCHFGECTQLEGSEAWIGRGINLVKQVAEAADPDALYVTGNVLDVVDLPLYQFQEAETRTLEGDHLPQRILYRATAFHKAALDSKLNEQLTAEAWFLKAAALIGTRKENSEEEAQYYQRALHMRPEYPEAHNNLAVLLRARSEEAAATEHYREALRLRPEYPEAHYNYAVLLQFRGSMMGAADHYREALLSRPDYVDAHYGYATLLNSTSDLVGAEEHYTEALRLRPQYAEVHNNYAILLEDKGEPQRAQEHFRTALRIRLDYPEAHYNYAILLENEGDLSNAEAQYREALYLRQDYPEAHNNLAILLHTNGDLVGAIEHYQEALRLRADDPETHYNYALLLKANGDQLQAEEHLRIAYELAPMEWVAALQQRNEPQEIAPTSPYPDGLTQREVEVLRLIAVGKSNRDIAEDLVISLSTVAHHVTSILGKTGATNRTEAAAYATRNGLTSAI